METKWIIKPLANEAEVNRLANELNVDTIIANLLVQREIKDFEQAKSFFRPTIESLYNPYLMKDMDKAVERLWKAISNNERILIYGDYDVDGTTSVALVYSYLKRFATNMDYYIPDRYAEGYGISYKAIDYAAENSISLIIALDCGIKAVEKVEYAKSKNIDFIICDHHNPGSVVPNAAAVLDPKRPDCEYPFKELSGCGVGFKFMQALEMRENNTNGNTDKPLSDNLLAYLDLVCVSIASDIVPIVDENRVLALYGLQKINTAPRMGLKSIIDVSGIKDKQIEVSDVVFKIGPRINAAGRIESGKQAVDLLIADESAFASQMGQNINDFNVTRKNLDAEITQEALAMIENDQEMLHSKATVLYKPYWHKGVIGIVASRMIEHYYRPTIILTESNGMATGSARSVDGFNLYNAIDACSHLLEGFGGHKYAAGLTLKLANLPEFKKRFNEVVAETITEEQLAPTIEIDAEINFADITPKLYRVLKQFAPFGPGNMRPIFITRNVKDCGYTRLVGADESHLRLDVMQKGKAMTGIAFSMAKYYEDIASGKLFDVCYTVVENDFNGKTSLQLMVKDIKISEE